MCSKCIYSMKASFSSRIQCDLNKVNSKANRGLSAFIFHSLFNVLFLHLVVFKDSSGSPWKIRECLTRALTELHEINGDKSTSHDAGWKLLIYLLFSLPPGFKSVWRWMRCACAADWTHLNSRWVQCLEQTDVFSLPPCHLVSHTHMHAHVCTHTHTWKECLDYCQCM